MRIVFTLFLSVVIIYCSSKFLVGGEDCEDEYPFKIDADLIRVENFIIEYTKYLTNPLRWARNKVIPKKKDTKRDVCTFRGNLKIFMCKVLIKLNYYSLQFVDEGVEGLTCGHQEISLRIRPAKKLKTRNVNMFRCPKLKYRSLGTEEVVTLPIMFYISNTQTKGSGCLYVQYGPNDPIFPQKIFSNIDENELFGSYVRDANHPRIQEPPRPFDGLITDHLAVQREFLRFVDSKKQSDPYLKFAMSYMKSSTCGMPQSHKEYVCQLLSQHDYFKSSLDLEGYDEATCRREEVQSRNNKKRFTMPLYKCPPLYLKSQNSKQFLEHSLYLSTNAAKKSVIVYHRLNFKEKPIRVDSYVTDLDDQILSIDRRRTREFSKHDHFTSQRRDTVEEVPALNPLPQQNLLYPPFAITTDRRIVEDNVVQLIETMKMKEPYTRFQLSFAKINVSGLQQEKIIRLCQFILEEETKYHLKLSDMDKLNPAELGLLSHIRVKLVMRDAEKLPGDKLRSRQCPPVITNRFKYFVSTSAKNDAVIVYVKYDHEVYYSIPEAFVSNIEKNIVMEGPANIPRSISIRP